MAANQTDILIAGGGIAGLTLAILLAQAGFSVTAVDPAPAPSGPPRPTGRTVALMQGSTRIIKATGIWNALPPVMNPLRLMRIIDDSAAPAPAIISEFPAADIGLDAFGYNIPNGDLHAALLARAQVLPLLRLLHRQSVAGYRVHPANVDVLLESQKTLKARLLIGADGRHSTVRKTAGIAVAEHDYKQSAITCIVTHAKPHDDSASEFHRPAGPLALVPLAGRQSSVVWVEPKEKADAIMRLARHDFLALLQKNTDKILGVFDLVAGPESWPLKTLKAKSLIAPRMALIAEAAHVLSPITAQGLNLSLRDAAALAETLVDARRCGEDIGSEAVLARYAARRRLDVETRVMGVDGMNRIVSTDILPLKTLRRAGLRTVSALPPLRHSAMLMMLAPQIDEGRLAQGLPL